MGPPPPERRAPLPSLFFVVFAFTGLPTPTASLAAKGMPIGPPQSGYRLIMRRTSASARYIGAA